MEKKKVSEMTREEFRNLILTLQEIAKKNS